MNKNNDCIIYKTSNNLKFQIAKEIMSNTKIVLQNDYSTGEVDEPQSENVEYIAEKSVITAYNYYKKNVAVTDAGFYITSLKGFPGPFVKYINNYLLPEQVLKLLDDSMMREVIIKECLAIHTKSGINYYYSNTICIISKYVGKGIGTTFEKIIIPKGYNKTLSEFSEKEKKDFWINQSAWNKFKNTLKSIENGGI